MALGLRLNAREEIVLQTSDGEMSIRRASQNNGVFHVTIAAPKSVQIYRRNFEAPAQEIEG